MMKKQRPTPENNKGGGRGVFIGSEVRRNPKSKPLIRHSSGDEQKLVTEKQRPK